MSERLPARRAERRADTIGRTRLAVVGCGAVTEQLHLPALALAGLTPVLLVDPALDRASQLAAQYGVPEVAATPEDCVGRVDAAIVAVPIPFHASVTCMLLDAGLHVLLEKPLARDVAECQAVIAAAERSSGVLAVGLMRRFLLTNQWLHSIIESGQLGAIRAVDIREGYPFAWPVTTFGFFHPDAGGVLKDLGAHTIDLLLWHFGGVDLESIDYRDSAHGGVETDCLLTLRTSTGVPCTLELSRGRSLRNTFIVEGERATVELAHFGEWARVRPRGRVTRPPRRDRAHHELFVAEYEDWLRAATTGGRPLVDPVDAMRAVELIERCYGGRQWWELPWTGAPVA